MSVTEFAVLEARAPYTVDSPIVRAFLQRVAQRQSTWSGYPLLFFRHEKTPAIIFLISGWKDVPAHYEWIASEGNQELLGEAESILAVKDFHHLEINFDTMPLDVSHLSWEVLPGSATGDDRRSAESSSDGAPFDPVWLSTGKVLEEEGGELYRLKGFKTGGEGADLTRSLMDGHHSVTGTHPATEAERSAVKMLRLSL